MERLKSQEQKVCLWLCIFCSWVVWRAIWLITTSECRDRRKSSTQPVLTSLLTQNNFVICKIYVQFAGTLPIIFFSNRGITTCSFRAILFIIWIVHQVQKTGKERQTDRQQRVSWLSFVYFSIWSAMWNRYTVSGHKTCVTIRKSVKHNTQQFS